MVDQYTVTKTSGQSAEVGDIVLTASTTTRLVMRSTLVTNANNPDASVKITLVHQRKSLKNNWEDAAGEPLSTLKAGQEIKLALDSAATLELRRHLENVYALHNGGDKRYLGTELVVGREDEIIKTDAGRAKTIKALLEQQHSEEIWDQLIAADPDLATRLSYSRIQADRGNALEIFRQALDAGHDENWWQDFFEGNNWIFGYGLKYCFLNTLQAQPHYGGTAVTGRGGEKGDFLAHSEAQIKFTVLVEIKKPSSPLFQGASHHRNGAWLLGNELIGGVSQLQANCQSWELEGSRSEANREELQSDGIYTVSPKGILVIGSCEQFSSDREKRNTFELFRRNLNNPEVITFDELYERAKFIVGHEDDLEVSVNNNDQAPSEFDGDIPW